MSSPDSLRLDDELGRLLKAYDQGIGDADGDAPTLHIQELSPELLKMLDAEADVAVRSSSAAETFDAPSGNLTGPLSPTHRVGRFELRRLLGKGGFGIVFLAYDPKLCREVALKIPRPEMLLSADARRRLAREALAAAGFDHPNLVPVYETGEIGPVCFIATGFCPGETLADWLSRQAYPVPTRQAARLVAILAEAVQHAHYRGVLHRDLKPNNVLLQVIKSDPAEQKPALGSCVLRGERFLPRVVDFGLAKVTERSAVETGVRQILGTPRYMAPEQAQARNEDIGPTADVYALGVILYELLTGRAPYDGETDVEVLRQSIEGNFTAPRSLRPDLPRDLEAICLKAMARQRQDRYPSALDLADDLRRFLSGLPTLARPLGNRARAYKWLRRNDQAVALGLVTSLALFFLLVGTWSGYQSRRLKYDHDTVLKQQETTRLQDRDRSYAQAVRNAYHYWRAGDAFPMAGDLEEGRRLAALANEPTCFAHNFVARLISAPSRVITTTFGPVLCLAITLEGDRWITGHEDGTLALWDAGMGRLLSSASTGGAPVKLLALGDSGRRVLSQPAGQPTRVWSVDSNATLTERASFTLPGRVTSMISTPDQTDVFLGTHEGWCVRMKADAAPPTSAYFTVEDGVGPEGLAFSPDGKTLAVRGATGKVSFWNAVSATRLEERPFVETAHRLRFLPTAKAEPHLAFLQGEDNVVRALSPDGLRESTLATPPGRVSFFRASDDGELVATVGNESSLCVWDRRTGLLRNLLQGHPQRVLAADFRAKSRTLVSGSEDGTLAEWELTENPAGPKLRERPSPVVALHHDSQSENCLIAFADGSVESTDREAKLRGPGGPSFEGLGYSLTHMPIGVEFSEQRITCRRIEAAGETILEKTAEPGFRFTAFVISADGRRLAVGDEHGRLKIWSVETGEELGSFHAEPAAAIRSIHFRHEGDWIAIREVNGKFGTMTSQGLGPLVTLVDPTIESPPLRHLSTIQRLAIAGRGSSIKICELEGRVRSTLIGHTGELTGVAVTPDGRILVSGSSTGEVKFWSLRTGQELFGMNRHTGPVTLLAFSADGRRLITGGSSRQGRGEYAIWNAGTK